VRGEERNAHLSLLDLTKLLVRRLDLLALVPPEAADELTQISLEDTLASFLRDDLDQSGRDLELATHGFGILDLLHDVGSVEDPGVGRSRGVVKRASRGVGLLLGFGGGRR
jgi:hypothetical protein